MIPGAIILVDSKGFLPDQIRLHMAIEARRTGRKPVRWNHTETTVPYNDKLFGVGYRKTKPNRIPYDGELMSMGARGGGAAMTPLDEYLAAHPKHLIKPPIVPLTPEEIKRLEAYAEDVCFKNPRKYQKGMFLAWIARLKLGTNWGEKGDKRVYCYELVAHCADLLKRWPYKEGQLISIYPIIENYHYGGQ